MPKLKAIVYYDLCKPEKCDPAKGICTAVSVCKRRILEQEEPFDAPICFPDDMCQSCGDCTRVCPLIAIKME